MAGGKSSRLGELGRLGPKCLLGLSDGQNLLGRLLDQLRMARMDRITVCCSAQSIVSIEPFLDEYRANTRIPPKKLTAAVCVRCKQGPLPALAEACSRVRSEWYLLCLADIVYADGPFGRAMGCLARSPVDVLLVTGSDQMRMAGEGSGFVHCEQRKVRSISYQAFPSHEESASSCRRWSGSLFFRRELLLAEGGSLAEQGAAPFEDWIQGLLAHGVRCEWTEGGPFFNVNSRQDYEAVLHHCRHRNPMEAASAHHANTGSCLG